MKAQNTLAPTSNRIEMFQVFLEVHYSQQL